MPSPRQPDVYDALFGPLPEGWRERKGLAAAPGAGPLRPAGSGATPEEKDAAANAAPPPRRPGAPETPWQLGRQSWIAVLKRVATEFSRDRVTSVAGGVTFFALLALFPAITALVSIYGRVADPTTIADNVEAMSRVLPDSAVELIAGQVNAIASAPATALSIAGIVSILIALWSANGGMKALIEALNIAWYETEKRGFIKLNLVSMALTLSAIIGIMALVTAIAVIPVILSVLMPGSMVETLVGWLRWPLMLGLLILGLAVIYRYGPSKNDPAWQWISPGALLAAAGLMIASAGFSFYVSNFANYNQTYGSLGAVIVMMMWLWIGSIVVLTGAELNSELERQIKIENGVTPKGEDDLASR